MFGRNNNSNNNEDSRRFQHNIEKLIEIDSRKIRNEKTTKGLIMASYDDSYEKVKSAKEGGRTDITCVDDLVFEQVDGERRSGNFYLNHLILRDSTAEIDLLKHLLLIDDIPCIDYNLMNLFESNLSLLATVGSYDIEKSLEFFEETFNPEKKNLFGHEGKELGVDRTLKIGRDLLKPENELVYAHPADLPFLYDVNRIIRPNRIQKRYQAIFNVNTKEKNGKFWPRNYHFNVKTKLRKYKTKECNPLMLDLNATPFEVVGSLYRDWRKFYSNPESRQQLPIDKEDIYQLFWNNKLEALRIIAKFASKLPGKKIEMRLASYVGKLYNLFDRDLPTIKRSTLRAGISMLFNMKVMVLTSNKDPATIEDQDSFEDWCYMNEMMRRGKGTIYLHYDKIQKRKKSMPDTRKQIQLHENFAEFINEECKRFGLFDIPYYADRKTPFLLRAPYNSKGELDIAFAHPRVDKMINDSIRFKQKYLKHYLRREAIFRKEYK